MNQRRPIIGGNWKMNTDRVGATTLASGVRKAAENLADIDLFVAPPFPYLLSVGEALRGGRVALGAQDAWPETNGAITGEVSLSMLKDCGVSYLLTGHSERRHVIGESDALINRKTRAGLDAGLMCVLCVGETLEQRLAGQTNEVNERQIRAGLAGVSASLLGRLVIAYEPVWAIGTGKTATPSDAQAAHAFIRSLLSAMFGTSAADSIRIQYGGSVKSSNAAELFRQRDIDGGLIGGASLQFDEFAAICRAGSGGRGAEGS